MGAFQISVPACWVMGVEDEVKVLRSTDRCSPGQNGELHFIEFERWKQPRLKGSWYKDPDDVLLASESGTESECTRAMKKARKDGTPFYLDCSTIPDGNTAFNFIKHCKEHTYQLLARKTGAYDRKRKYTADDFEPAVVQQVVQSARCILPLPEPRELKKEE